MLCYFPTSANLTVSLISEFKHLLCKLLTCIKCRNPSASQIFPRVNLTHIHHQGVKTRLSPSFLSLRLLAYPSSPIAAPPGLAPECDLSNRLNGTVGECQISPSSPSTCRMRPTEGKRCRRRHQLSHGVALTVGFKDL
jgi:hypothetical protein